MVPVWILKALTYHLKGIPYRDFLPKGKHSLEMGLSQQEPKKPEEDALEESEKIALCQRSH